MKITVGMFVDAAEGFFTIQPIRKDVCLDLALRIKVMDAQPESADDGYYERPYVLSRAGGIAYVLVRAKRPEWLPEELLWHDVVDEWRGDKND